MDHVSLVEDKDKWWSLNEHGNVPMVPYNRGNFLTH